VNHPANHSLSAILLDVVKIGLTFFLCLILFFFTLFAYIKVAGPLPFAVNSTTTQKNDAFHVNGEGKASAKADKATVRLGVTATTPTKEEIAGKLNEGINAVTASVKALGVADADIKTENYITNPVEDYTSSTRKITGYRGDANIVVTVKDTNLANKIIDAASAAGATAIGGVSFDTIDKTAAENEARDKAIADAKQKAQRAAQAGGFKLGKLMNYNENFGGGVMPYAARESFGTANDMKLATPTQLEPGSNEIVVSVTLSYEIL
jgi:uncharacterized protein YggE